MRGSSLKAGAEAPRLSNGEARGGAVCVSMGVTTSGWVDGWVGGLVGG